MPLKVEQRQYETYILTDPVANSRLELVPERGGIVTKWCVEGQDILYLDTERFAQPDLSIRGGIPILFPICGNLPNDTYTYRGQTYMLKQHGFARDLPWSVSDRPTHGTADSSNITLILNSNDRTRAVYPFDFQVAFTYEIQGNTLSILQSYTNLSSDPMPFSVGLHPYFAVADKEQLQLEIPGSEFTDQTSQTVSPFTGKFDFSCDAIDVAFLNVSDRVATFTDPVRSLHLTLEYDTNYTTLVFWALKGKDYVCLEPWTAPRNALNTGNNLTVLEPGTRLEMTVRVTARFGES